eukprot:7400220-Pyramimonas_sp.AAC.1
MCRQLAGQLTPQLPAACSHPKTIRPGHRGAQTPASGLRERLEASGAVHLQAGTPWPSAAPGGAASWAQCATARHRRG